MRKIITYVSIILLCSCSLYLDEYNDNKFSQKINIPLSTHKIPVKHESQIFNYINLMVDYQLDSEDDNWQSLEESINRGKGDCEDFCIAFSDILKRQFNKDSEIVLVDIKNAYPTGEVYHDFAKTNNRKIEYGGRINHAMVRVDNKIVDPQNGKVYNAVVSFSYKINFY